MFLATYKVFLRDTPRTTEVGHMTQAAIIDCLCTVYAAIASFLLHVGSFCKLVGSLDGIRLPLR